MSLSIFLNYYDGEYRVGQFDKIEIKNGTPYFNGVKCNIGDKFVVPAKCSEKFGTKYVPMQTYLGYCPQTDTWHFKGFENYKADEIYSRKV